MSDLCGLNCLEVKCLQMWLSILTGHAMHFDKLNVLKGGRKATLKPFHCDNIYMVDH